jgi:pyruvate/2-oxoglutarate dehydrogenase complex dihydrolipoamide dehydrogenase (E3) component
MGIGSFVAPKTLEVQLNDRGTRRLTGDKVFIDVGSHAAMPSIPSLAEARPLMHIEALDLDNAPSHLIVLGGGYVGLELAQAYRRFGSRATVIETGPQIIRAKRRHAACRGMMRRAWASIPNAQALTAMLITTRTRPRGRA